MIFFLFVCWSNHQNNWAPDYIHVCVQTQSPETQNTICHKRLHEALPSPIWLQRQQSFLVFLFLSCFSAALNMSWGCRQSWLIHFLLLINTRLQLLPSTRQREAIQFHSLRSFVARQMRRRGVKSGKRSVGRVVQKLCACVKKTGIKEVQRRWKSKEGSGSRGN